LRATTEQTPPVTLCLVCRREVRGVESLCGAHQILEKICRDPGRIKRREPLRHRLRPRSVAGLPEHFENGTPD
jgi:hypothetical protein